MRHPATAVAFAALSFLLPPKSAAAVIVLANMTGEPVRLTFTHPGKPPAAVELAVGEVRPVPCGRTVDVSYPAAGKQSAFRLDAYGAYVLVPNKGSIELRGIDLLGRPVPTGDVLVDPPAAAEPLKVPVRLLVDDADRRTRQAWEPAVRKRLERAAEIVAAHCPVKFEVVGVGTWHSNPEAADLAVLHAEFQTAVKPDPARLAIGFTSRAAGGQPGEGPFAVGKAAFRHHILLREGEPRTEAERVEVLVQQLGKYLGAVHSPDPNSVMRVKLGDGKAAHAKFRVGFDPLNTLAMNLWVEEMRSGKVAKYTDLRPAAQGRLGQVYATLAEVLSEEPLPEEYAGLVAKATVNPTGPAAVAEPNAARRPEGPPAVQAEPPRPAAPAGAGLTSKQEAVRKVVKAVVLRAEQNARKQGNGKLDGDDLTADYVKAAADVARFEDKAVRSAALCIGLGIALDDSEILRKNPVATALCKAVESDDERKARLAVLGRPKVRDRRDLCQHFAVSAALTELVGATLAEQAGLAKELLDMRGDSGFSFTDLCADFAGVEFAKLARKDPDLLERWWRTFKVEDFVPKLEGLRDGLSEAQFKQLYGSVGDERFQTGVDEVRQRVRSLRIHTQNANR